MTSTLLKKPAQPTGQPDDVFKIGASEVGDYLAVQLGLHRGAEITRSELSRFCASSPGGGHFDPAVGQMRLIQHVQSGAIIPVTVGIPEHDYAPVSREERFRRELEKAGNPSEPAERADFLIRLISTASDSDAKRFIPLAVAEIRGHGGAIPRLAESLDDPNAGVRLFCFAGLTALEPVASVKARAALPTLRRLLSTSGNDETGARLCIRLMDKLTPDEPCWQEILLALSGHPSLAVRAEAARAIASRLIARKGSAA